MDNINKFNLETSEKPMSGWFEEEDADEQAEDYLSTKSNYVLGFIESQMQEGESPKEFQARLKKQIGNPIFQRISFGESEISIESKNQTGALKISSTTVDWNSNRKKPGIMDEIFPKIDLYSELSSRMYLGSSSTLDGKMRRFFLPLVQFQKLSIQFPEGQDFDFQKVLPGYKLFAPLEISKEVADMVHRMRTSYVDHEYKYIVVTEPLNTPDGIFSLLHEIGHGYIRTTESDEEKEFQSRARFAEMKGEVLEGSSRVAVMESERMATAFALRQIKKLSKYLELPNEEIVADAYLSLASYIVRTDSNNETKQDIIKKIKEMFGLSR